MLYTSNKIIRLTFIYYQFRETIQMTEITGNLKATMSTSDKILSTCICLITKPLCTCSHFVSIYCSLLGCNRAHIILILIKLYLSCREEILAGIERLQNFKSNGATNLAPGLREVCVTRLHTLYLLFRDATDDEVGQAENI